jgi:hypothetical protein
MNEMTYKSTIHTSELNNTHMIQITITSVSSCLLQFTSQKPQKHTLTVLTTKEFQ